MPRRSSTSPPATPAEAGPSGDSATLGHRPRGDEGQAGMGTIIFIGLAVLMVVVFITVWRRNRRYEEE